MKRCKRLVLGLTIIGIGWFITSCSKWDALAYLPVPICKASAETRPTVPGAPRDTAVTPEEVANIRRLRCSPVMVSGPFR
jgi:hypothetical protein